MRNDMADIINEPAKRGSNFRSKKGDPLRKAGLEDQPSYESMKVRHSERHYGNYNLGPLQRWLKKQIGRPWNDVFSEACDQLRNKPNKGASRWCGRDLVDLVKREVEQNVKMIDGLPHVCGLWDKAWHEIGSYREELYVHPDTSLLQKHKMKERVEPKKERKFSSY